MRFWLCKGILAILLWCELCLCGSSAPDALDDRLIDETNTTGEVKGVTLGGWLVTEPYITPSLFEDAQTLADNGTSHNNDSAIVDEFTLCKVLGYEDAKKLLEKHFNSWITENDFKQIREDGFNLVRLPIGYWAWKQNHTKGYYIGNVTYKDPYVSDGLQLEKLEQALQWAQKYGLQVWIDLHGAPGSQNGFDNSGQRDLYAKKVGWLKLNHTEQLTKVIWNEMFERYLNKGSNSTVVGIEIINEPLAPKLDQDAMMKSYYEAFDMFKRRQDDSDNTTFVIHDAFLPLGYWDKQFDPDHKEVMGKYLNTTQKFHRNQILVDHHHYEVFTDGQLAESQWQRLRNIQNFAQSIGQELSHHPAVVGEWSAALTDCARWLNGVGVGARYDGGYYNTTKFHTDDKPIGKCISQQSVEDWPKEYKKQVRQFIEAQLSSFSAHTSGYIFWNYKTEGAIEWDYLALKKHGLFPQPLDNYKYFEKNGSMRPSVSKSLSRQATSTSQSNRNAGVSDHINRGHQDNYLWLLLGLLITLCIFF
ncbi:hypothetical protein ZYGR_0AD04220 [Zygosaccharomyces rouxii]|uniref:Glycoside hydrolase family 5 domain-containing protein n=1 Tax=Zygosaccharomyces rouxii TaxID=4956 RepID=A0A1Q3A6A1_ZYGRO|nr:hypothetical protein ZYGR_0AD04220 [Zygosaccharomyces rouxii]